MKNEFPDFVETSLIAAHPSWHSCLRQGVLAVSRAEPDYFSRLAERVFLPTGPRLFAAFSIPLSEVRYVLMGEGPYPREKSATGVCFMDGAVDALWEPGVGLSKSVNKATSLRNFMKMLLVAEGVLDLDNTKAAALVPVADNACLPGSTWIRTGAQLQHNLLHHGFLLLNASLVFRSDVKPIQDAKSWRPFLTVVLQELLRQQETNMHDSGSDGADRRVELILWGKMAEKMKQLPEANQFKSYISEHPYNLSFIRNQVMLDLFRRWHLLRAR